MADVVTNNAKNVHLNRIFKSTPDNTEPSYFVCSASSKTPTAGDSELEYAIGKSTTTIDAMDAITGWSNSGDADTEVLNTTSGEFREGTGCLNLPITHSTGTAAWEKTVSSVDLSNNFVSLFFYIDDKTNLSNVSDAFSLFLGTSGFTNSYEYHVSKTDLSTGWNQIGFDVSNGFDTTNGSGATLTGVDRVKIQLKITGNYTGNSIRADLIHYSTEANLLVSISSGFPTFDTGVRSATIKGVIEATEMNDGTPDINKVYVVNNDSSKVLMYEHTLSSSLSKTNKTRITLTETTTHD